MTADPRFVPKVHPATRAVEPDDPMTLYATPVPGDPEWMMACVVEEFARMGWGAGQILGLFRSPFYPALYDLRQHHGEAWVRERVEEVLARTGAFRVRVTEAAEEEKANEPGPEMVPLGLGRCVGKGH
jgi:hypothetical protein